MKNITAKVREIVVKEDINPKVQLKFRREKSSNNILILNEFFFILLVQCSSYCGFHIFLEILRFFYASAKMLKVEKSACCFEGFYMY